MNHAIMLNPDVYKSTVWWEYELLEELIDIKREIMEYYQDVAISQLTS